MTTPTPSDADARAVETAWRIHTELGNWTAKVDAKASFALTLESAATAGVIALSTDDHVLANLHGWGTRSLLWTGTVLILISGIFSMLVVVPRLRARKVKAEAPSNFIYFGHLMHREADELTAVLKQTDILPVLSRQLIVMSKIAWGKHRHVQLSFSIFGVGATLVFLAGLLN
ncbi:Pycsar system effector family protein [Streptomyces sp. enrichment culture]|uniref:Pycsar system effector family protein n=1 Tax=Streptomyces sp. enrichment culture TaxID=1795815 RepID=UPI003F56252B